MTNWKQRYVELSTKQLLDSDRWQSEKEATRTKANLKKAEILDAVIDLFGLRETYPDETYSGGSWQNAWRTRHGWEEFERDLLAAASAEKNNIALEKIRSGLKGSKK